MGFAHRKESAMNKFISTTGFLIIMGAIGGSDTETITLMTSLFYVTIGIMLMLIANERRRANE